MYAALHARRNRLLAELAEVNRDLDAVWRTASVELRQRQSAAVSGGMLHAARSRHDAATGTARPETAPVSDGVLALAAPAPRDPDGARNEGPALAKPGTPFEGAGIPPAPETVAALATLGPTRDDRSLPPTVDARGQRLEVAGMPTGGAALAAARAGVDGIAAEARKAPPGPGGRRMMSSKGLVPGEPLMPALRNVLRAAGRPLTSLDAALAMLGARNLAYEGPELVAVVNRVSALFGQEAAKRKMRRIPQEGSRAHLWEMVEPEGEPPLDAAAHMRGRKSQPSGSTG